MIPESLKPFPAEGGGLAANLRESTNAFVAAATSIELAHPDGLATPGTKTLTDQVKDELDGEGVVWSPGLAQRIADLAQNTQLSEEVAAAAVADAIDRAQGSRFDELLAGTGTWTLEAGDPYPVAAAPLDWHDDRMSHPVAQPRTPGDLRNLRFAPPLVGTFEVRFHCHDADVLVLPPFGSVVATGHPDLALAECGEPGEVAPDGFFGFPNRDPSHDGWVRDVVAAAAGAHVVVLPELSVDDGLAAELVATWRGEHIGSRAHVFVPGSRHIEVDGRRANRTEVHVSGLDAPLVADKQAPFATGGRTEALDAIATGVDIHVVGRWRIAACICLDALRTDVPQLLAQLGVTLLIIPAMSPDATGFEPLSALVKANAGVFVVANNPAEWPKDDHHPVRRPAQMVIGLPLGHPAGPTVNVGAGGNAVRGVWRIGLDDGLPSHT